MPTTEEAMGRVTDLQTGVTEMHLPQYAGVCDWCTDELTLPFAAIHNFAVEITFPNGIYHYRRGQVGHLFPVPGLAAPQRRGRPGVLRRGGSAVAHPRPRYLEGYFGENARRIRVSTFYAEDDSGEETPGL